MNSILSFSKARTAASLAFLPTSVIATLATAQPLPTTRPEEVGLNTMTGSAGEYRWGGAGGTAFWVDPKEQMVVVWMAQGLLGPRRSEDRELFRNLVQAAIVD